MSRHAYLILAHKNPRQVCKLVELLDDSRNDIFIHIDKKSRQKGWKDLRAEKAGLYVLENPISVNWGGTSGMKSELLLLKKALATSRYDYYHLISGQDLPLKSQDEIHRFFDENQGKEFLNLWEMGEHARARFELVTLFPEGESKFYIHAVNKIGKMIQKSLGYKRKGDVEYKFGSNWFSITDDFARYVADHEQWLLKTFKNINNCDELFLSTLIWNSPYRKNLYRDDEASIRDKNDSFMRYVDWDREGCYRHPWIFREEDFDTLMSVPHLFARKFDEQVDSRIIDKIYKRLKGEV